MMWASGETCARTTLPSSAVVVPLTTFATAALDTMASTWSLL